MVWSLSSGSQTLQVRTLLNPGEEKNGMIEDYFVALVKRNLRPLSVLCRRMADNNGQLHDTGN